MTQLADLQRIPAKQLVSAADKPTGSLIETDLFHDLLEVVVDRVGVQISAQLVGED